MELNDDCLLTIFEFLSLKDQTCAALACPRFNDVLSFLWQRKYTKYSGELGKDLTREELTVLLAGICATLQEIDIEASQWSVIELFSYPNLRTLGGFGFRGMDDIEVLKMTQIFPNLREFRLVGGNFSGKYMEKWRYLEDLDVAKAMEAEYFEKILGATQLKKVVLDKFIGEMKWTSTLALQNFLNLEEIGLFNTFLKSLPDISRFKSLKVLKLYGGLERDLVLKLFKQIGEHKYNDLTEVIIDTNSVNGTFPLGTLFVRECMNVRKLSVIHSSVSDVIGFLKWVPNLREITIQDGRTFRKEHIYSIIRLCPQIKFINIDGYLSGLTFDANVLAMNRTTLLHLNIFEKYSNSTRFFNNFPRVETPLLKFTSKRILDCEFSPNTFRFH